MDQKIINILKTGGVGVIPTDTIYGLVGQALNSKTVERVYQLKKRAPEKPTIILISALEDLVMFNIKLDQQTKEFLEKIWPNPVSVILDCPNSQFQYLHRGTHTLAFRIPNKPDLLDLLTQTGPLVAPSANPEGKPAAQTIEEAKQYFEKEVDFLVDGGRLTASPSTLIQIQGQEIIILRQGSFKLEKNNRLSHK